MNQFAPNDLLTRGEMAVLLTRAFNLQVDANVNVPFTDIKGHPYEKEIKAIYQAGLTTGETATTFNPTGMVTRAEFATFLYRSDMVREHIEAKQYNKETDVYKINNLSDTSARIGGKTYQLSDKAKKLLNKVNEKALVNAYISFEQTNNIITDITYLAMTNNVDLNGNQVEINGNVVILADEVTLENVTITGDLIIGKKVKKSFTGKQLEVDGTTIVNGMNGEVSIKNTTGTNITFIDSSLQLLNSFNEGANLSLSGTSSLTSLGVYANNIEITSQSTIPTLIAGADVNGVRINGNIESLIVQSIQPFTISGTGNISNITVNGCEAFTVNTSGTIGSLTINDASTKIIIGLNTRITNLILPANVEAKDVIADYDKVKGNIEQISGKANPDITSPTVGGSSGTGGGSPGTGVQPQVTKITVTSDFNNNGALSSQYSFEGDNTSLPISWTPVTNAKSYALIMYDSDAVDPMMGPFVHWVVKDIDPKITKIEKGLSRSNMMPGVEFTNFFAGSPIPQSFQKGYAGPWPPEKHHYIIAVYSLNSSFTP